MDRAGDGAQIGGLSMAPTSTTACAVCGAPLGDRFRVVDYPKAAHLQCIDWRHEPFPFARHLDVLRLLARRLPAGDDQRALLALRSRLQRLARHWPERALHVLDEGRHLVDAARRHVAGLDHRDRQRL